MLRTHGAFQQEGVGVSEPGLLHRRGGHQAQAVTGAGGSTLLLLAAHPAEQQQVCPTSPQSSLHHAPPAIAASLQAGYIGLDVHPIGLLLTQLAQFPGECVLGPWPLHPMAGRALRQASEQWGIIDHVAALKVGTIFWDEWGHPASTICP